MVEGFCESKRTTRMHHFHLLRAHLRMTERFLLRGVLRIMRVFHWKENKGTVRRGEVDPDSSSKTGNQLLLQRNSNEHDQRKEERLEPGSDSSPSIGNQSQLTEGSCKPDAASKFYRKWEPQGARPKLTQRPVDPPLWPSASPVSEGLAQDSLPGQTDVSWVRNGMSSDEVNTSNRLLPPDDFGTSDHSLAGEQDFGNAVKANDNPLAALSEKRQGKRGEQEASKWQEAGPSQQKDVSTGSQRLCEHYVRRCRVCFSCCKEFYPCHKCHNKSTKCENGQAKAGEATHLKCSRCQFEQAIDQSSGVCLGCGEEMARYFCFTCKHLKSLDKNPYHCDQCGICRHYKDKKFHCEVCGVCLDKRLENNHKCRPDSGHDECGICLEDTFRGCLITPCSHRVHLDCARAMKRMRVSTCPMCSSSIVEWLKTRVKRKTREKSKGHH